MASPAADIAGGLPRVVELFEARSPKGKATLARTAGVVRIAEDEGKGRVITVVADDGTEEAYTVPSLARLEVVDGQEINAGDPIVDGPRDPKELLEIKGVRETQQYLVDEVQKVYRDQGVSIHDKHIELIVRQMTRRVAVQEPGDSDFLPGRAGRLARCIADVNRALVMEGKQPAEGRPEIMGITKASLATDSWLSAASFQETTRVLTEAAIESRSDSLLGLKENIIIGKLIPAGTGMDAYRDITTSAPDYQPMEYYSSGDDDADLADMLAERMAGDLVAAAGDLAAGGDEQPDAEVIELPAGRRLGLTHPGAAGRACPAGVPRAFAESVRAAPSIARRLWRGSRRSGARSNDPEEVRRKGSLCPPSSSWSARAASRSPQRARRRRSRALRSAAACARASTRPPRRSRTPRCARSPVCA